MSFPISITWSGGSPPVAGFQQMAAAAAKLDSSLQTTVGKMDQFGNSISQMEAPIGGVANGVSQLEGSIGGLEGSIGGAASGMESFAGSTESLNGSISETGGFVTDATGSMSDFGGAATEAGGAATEFGSAATEANTGVTELGTASSDTGGFVTELGTATGETNTVLGETNTVLGETVPAMAETATGAQDTTTAFTDLNPAVTDTTGALDSGIPIFEGAGTAAADAGAATDTFSGALSGMAEPLEGVTGGLDANNTLMGNLATSTGDTNTESGNLNSTLTTLGTGLGTVTGSAMSLYSAYTNVRDAQAAVEKAQIKVIDANRKAESAFIKLNSAVNKLTSDTENHITGQGRLAAAWQKVVDLWNAGVRSGPQLAAALEELKAAQDGMTSSTAKGNEMIAKLNPQISTFESNSRKAAGANLGLTRANEGLVESFIGVAGSLVSGVSGLVQISTQGGEAVKKLGPLAKVFGGIGTALTGTVIPALGAIAVPAAAAIAAITAFIGAVTAIRMNLKVFDEMGQTVGKVFPELKGFLDEGRQAFINFSDGLNTGISMLLGGFDSLTGGVFGAQKAWDGFTGTLPKGTGEMGLAAHAANLFSLAIGDSSDKIRVGAGKWKEADGVLMRLNGSVLAAAGTWDVLGDGTAVYLKSAQKVPPTMDQTKSSTDKAAESTNQMSEATKKASDELAAVGTSLEEANAKFAFYGEAGKLAELVTNSFALGIAEAKVALIDETAELAKGAGALMEHGRQMEEGSLQALAYKQGILEAGEALVKKVQALAQAEGAYDATNKLIEEGTLLAVEYASGMQETKTAVQDAAVEVVHLAGELAAYNDEATATAALNAEMAKGYLEQKEAVNKLAFETANAVGQIAALREELESSESAALRFSAGLIEGRKSALEWAVGLQTARGEALGFRDEVINIAGEIGSSFQDMSHLSTEAIQQIIEVAAGIPEAFEKTLNSMESWKNKFIDIMSKAGEDGSVNVMKNIEQLEQDLNVTFSAPLKEKIKIEVARDEAMGQIETLMGALATSLSNNPLKVEADTLPAQGAIQALVDKIDQAAAQGVTGLEPLRASLVALGQIDMTNISEFAPALARVVQEAKAAGEPFDGLMAKFQELGPLAQMSASELDAVSSAFQTMGLHLDTATGKITDATGTLVGEWGKWGVGAKGAETDVGAAMGGIGASGDAARDAWARDMQIMFLAVDQFGKHAQTMAGTVSGAYSNMSANVTASLNTLASGFIIILTAQTRLASDSQKMASTVSGSFSNLATNVIASMNRMASGFIIILTAMTRMSSESQRMASAVSASFNTMTSRAASFASGMQSSMSKAASSMASAESKARALASAINALKSKTITITTVYVTIRRTIFAAAGGSFVQSNPGKVGPLSVSEFGQQELVTVTPLQSPGRQPVKGLSDLLGKESEKKAKRAMTEEGEKEGKGKKEVVMMRETPIIVQVDGREIARVVNKRIFEESDALV